MRIAAAILLILGLLFGPGYYLYSQHFNGRVSARVELTERAERWLFWPMGIDSAGAMRQWGRHATAFVGRRHFDDADLLEKRFVLQLP